MKKIFVTTIVLAILISACSSSSSSVPSKSAPIATTQVPPTATATEIIPPTPTFTPIPTLSLPVSQLTPVPSSNTKITAENVNDLQEIARYYGEIDYFAKVTEDKKFLFILDPDGLTKYDYASMEAMVHVAVANSASDLQISDDGSWLILDNNWLLDLKNDKEPNLQALSEIIDLQNLQNRYSRDFALSPDGSKIAVEQMHCYTTCDHIFSIVSAEDFKVLHTQMAPTYQELGAFSPDGTYFALAELFIEAHPDGSTNPAGASVGVWTTKDFTKVLSVSVKYPFRVSGLAFSEDNALIAIAQMNSIDIYDVLSGESEANITDLCTSYQRKVMFAPVSPLRILENSDCSAGAWTISGSAAKLSIISASDFSRIVFDEKGNSRAVPYPQPRSNFKSYEWYYFTFPNNDFLSFKNRYSVDSHSCDLALAGGSFDCQSHSFEEKKDRILATNDKYYGYAVGKDKVDIYSSDDPGQVFYSIPFRGGLFFQLLALDPINNIVFYNIALSSSINRVVIQDMTNDRILEKWDGETFLSSIVFSENNKYATLCRTIGYNNRPNKDRLVIFDLPEKKIIYNENFTCSGASMAMTQDGSKLAIEYYYLRDPKDARYSTRVVIFNTLPPYDKIYFETESSSHALVFSPDDSLLAITCGESDICFLDPLDGKEIHRLKVHSDITSLAFSKDESLLATSSNWGLISLWAIPPFVSKESQTLPSFLSSINPSFYWNFDQEGYFEGWVTSDSQSVDLENLKVKDGYLSAKVTGQDPQIYTYENLGIDTSKFAHIEIRMRVSAGGIAQVFFRHDNDNISEEKSKIFSIQAGNEFNTYIIDMRDVASWNGMVSQLRFDPTSDAVGAIIEIDYIHILQ